MSETFHLLLFSVKKIRQILKLIVSELLIAKLKIADENAACIKLVKPHAETEVFPPNSAV